MEAQGTAIRRLDPRFKYRVAARPGGENIKACFACGVCTAGCPVAEIDEAYNPRRIIRQVLLGLEEEVLTSDLLWLCTTCFTCYAHCPQDVKFTDIMGVLRQMAVEQGYVHPTFVGRLEAMDELCQRLRRDMALVLLKEKTQAGEFDAARVWPQVAR
ncbi:MAG: 4Fe-4S dicluster domain-containing protein [Bacillota bacterium]